MTFTFLCLLTAKTEISISPGKVIMNAVAQAWFHKSNPNFLDVRREESSRMLYTTIIKIAHNFLFFFPFKSIQNIFILKLNIDIYRKRKILIKSSIWSITIDRLGILEIAIPRIKVIITLTLLSVKMSFIKESQTPTDTKTNIIITDLFEKEDEVETKTIRGLKNKKDKNDKH